MPSPADLQPDELVDGRYRVVKRLGAGAMGVIYLAQHVTLRRRVALKVLRAELVGDEDLAGRFESEARAASAIGHPHIVSVFDLGRCPDGSPYMAMEFLDGVALADHLAVSGALPWPKAVEIAGQVLAGLAAAHNHGIVHRDLKPENIFLVEQLPGVHHVKLLDFGISKVLANPSLRSERPATSYGTVMGTAQYMSPEQARGQNELVDEGTDIYATGVVLYEMLAGRTPFRGESYNAVLSAILERNYTPIGTECPLVPWELEVVVERAMAFERSRRFATANEMRDAVLKVEPGRTAVSAGDAPPLELVKLDRWATGGPPSVAIVPIAASVGGAAPAPSDEAPSTIELAELPPRRPPPVPRREYTRAPPAPPAPLRRRGGQRALAYLSLAMLAVGGVGWWRLRGGSLGAASAAEVSFDVKPESATLKLDGQDVAFGRASLAIGSSHALAASAPGFLAAEARFKAQSGRLGVRLVHALPSVDESDVPALPAAPPATGAPRTWDDVDRGIRRVEMLRECVVRARPGDCETLRNMARALTAARDPADDATDAYLRALGDARPGDVARAEAALRQALWAERARLDADELALVATDGLGDDDWRARRLLLAARAGLGSAESRAAAVELATLLHRAGDAALGAAADELVAALARRKKTAAAYSKLVELYDQRPVRSWPTPSTR